MLNSTFHGALRTTHIESGIDLRLFYLYSLFDKKVMPKGFRALRALEQATIGQTCGFYILIYHSYNFSHFSFHHHVYSIHHGPLTPDVTVVRALELDLELDQQV